MRVLITGGSSDIAKAIAKRRESMGDKVTITASSAKSLEKTLADYKASGIKADGIVFDLSAPEQSEKELGDLISFGLDAVVLNAAPRVTKLRLFHEYPDKYFHDYVSQSIFGNTWLLKQVIPSMLDRAFGRLVFISSVSAINGTSRYGAYCLAKSAMEGLFLNLALDYGQSNVLANILRPGLIATDRTRRYWSKPEYVERARAMIPQQALGTPGQVAEAIDPLLSPTSYMNGSVVTVSGGLPLIRSPGASNI